MQLTPVRFQFVDLLRGLAAVSVAFAHLSVLVLKEPELVARISISEPIKAVVFPEFIDQFISYFNFASIGVAVFFLISGFVIALSLDRVSVIAFFVQRFFRIFPVYWVAFALGVGALFISGAYWGKPVPYSATDYLANTFLIADFFGRYDIITVMWTLQIELKFYLLIPFFHRGLRKGSLLGVVLWGTGVPLFFLCAAISCGSGTEECWNHYRFGFRMVSREAAFITYMLIGSIFYAHYRRVISGPRAAIGAAFLFASFVLSAPFTPFASVTETYRLPFAWGLAIFLGCYLWRESIALTRPFRFLANVSYPLYVIHPLVGYVVIRLAMAQGAPYIVALVLALGLVFAVAFAIHVAIEAPWIARGKRLTIAKRRASDPDNRPKDGDVPVAVEKREAAAA